MPTIIRLVLGRHWRTATPGQKARFAQVFRTHLVRVYTAQLGVYEGEIMEIEKSVALSKKDTVIYTLVVHDKENVDCEALIWAFNRIQRRQEKRKILIVISDGAPVDDSTLSANPGNYLENHLRESIVRIEEKTDIDLIAIGIGHDVSRYYNNAITIMDVDQLGEVHLNELSNIFTSKKKIS